MRALRILSTLLAATLCGCNFGVEVFDERIGGVVLTEEECLANPEYRGCDVFLDRISAFRDGFLILTEPQTIAVDFIEVEWEPNLAIERFNIIVANNEVCTDVVRQVETSAFSWRATRLEDGEYFVCAFGYIDDQEIAARNNGVAITVALEPTF